MHTAGKWPGLDKVQIHPIIQNREERCAIAYQNKVGDEDVLVDQTARMDDAARVAPPMSIGPPSSDLS